MVYFTTVRYHLNPFLCFVGHQSTTYSIAVRLTLIIYQFVVSWIMFKSRLIDLAASHIFFSICMSCDTKSSHKSNEQQEDTAHRSAHWCEFDVRPSGRVQSKMTHRCQPSTWLVDVRCGNVLCPFRAASTTSRMSVTASNASWRALLSSVDSLTVKKHIQWVHTSLFCRVRYQTNFWFVSLCTNLNFCMRISSHIPLQL